LLPPPEDFFATGLIAFGAAFFAEGAGVADAATLFSSGAFSSPV